MRSGRPVEQSGPNANTRPSGPEIGLSDRIDIDGRGGLRDYRLRDARPRRGGSIANTVLNKPEIARS
jgi:hypothetical protein